jgi:hypothetical protein
MKIDKYFHYRFLRCVKKEDSGPPKDSNASKSDIPTEIKSPKDLRSREMRPIRAARETKVLKESKLEHPFGCSTCGENFTSAWYLKVHRRTHKNYHIPCQLCGKMFSHVTNLAKHMK